MMALHEKPETGLISLMKYQPDASPFMVLLRDLHGAKETLCSWVSLRQIWLMKTGPIAKSFFPQFR